HRDRGEQDRRRPRRDDPRRHVGPAGPRAQRRQHRLHRRTTDRPPGRCRRARRLRRGHLPGGPPHRPRRQDRRPAPEQLKGPAMGGPTGRDDDLFDLLDREVARQNTGLQLIASENFTSPAVMEATGSVLTNKYSEGYPQKRYYGGNQIVDDVEQLAIDRVKELFGAEFANVQPHSGANANLGVYLALLDAGDTVLGMSLDHGGHLTHGSPVNISGRFYNFVPYKVTPSDERIDYDQIRDLAMEHRPKLIVAGATAYPRVIDPEALRSIA